VGILANNRVEWIELCIAASASGAMATPFSTWSTPREPDFLLRDSGARILFTIERFGDRHFSDELSSMLADPQKRPSALERIVVIDQSNESARTQGLFKS